MKEIKYTHIITKGIDKGRKCFIYKNVHSLKDEAYIRTDDGRAYWQPKNEIEPIIDINKN